MRFLFCTFICLELLSYSCDTHINTQYMETKRMIHSVLLVVSINFGNYDYKSDFFQTRHSIDVILPQTAGLFLVHDAR